MRTRSLAAILAGLALASCQPTNDAATEPTLETDQDKLFYTLGLALSEGLASYALTPEEVERVILGVRDGVTGQPERIDDRMKYARMVRQLREERTREVAGREREQAVGYLVAQAAQPGAETRESGVVYLEREAGAGPTPAPTSEVVVHYHGTLRDGTVFDSTQRRGDPARFRVKGVIPCWTEALQLMKVGGKAQITCPPDSAYGDRGAGKIPPGSALTFEVELIAVNE